MKRERGAATILNPTERELQAAIVEFLTLNGWLVFQYAKGGTHGRRGEPGNLRGVVATGHPDIHAIHKVDAHLFLECKRSGRKLTLEQEKTHADIKEKGARVEVVHGVADVIDILRSMGYEMRFWGE